MKSLRLRFVIVVTLAALVPVVAVAFWARATVTTRAQEQDAHRLERTVAAAQRRVQERLESDRRAVARLCTVDFVVDRLVLDLAANRFEPHRQDELVAHLRPMMVSLGLDALELLDGRPEFRGEVLGSAHYPGRTGAIDGGRIAALERTGDSPFVTTVRVREGGETHSRDTVLHGCATVRGGVTVWIVGGRFVDRAVEDLAPEVDSVRVALESVHEASDARPFFTFFDSNRNPTQRLVAHVDDSELRAQLEELDQVFLVVGLGSVMLATLFGGLLALSLARPLAQLERAAARVGAGDLESTIGVRSANEVGRALSAFNRMTQDLKVAREKLRRAERTAAWRDIARRIAHEVKNPLSPIQVAIETMRKTYRKNHPDFEEIFDESTAAVLDEVQRLNRLVSEFSDFARMPAPQRHRVDVAELVRHTAALWNGERCVDVIVEVANTVPIIHGDRDQLAEVMTNLVKNGIEAAESHHPDGGGQVCIRAAPCEDGVEIRVEDNGAGISETDRARLFEPYFTTKDEGTGLGLAIVHRIVSDHEGSVSVETSPRGGTEMVVRLTVEGPRISASASQSDLALSQLTRDSVG